MSGATSGKYTGPLSVVTEDLVAAETVEPVVARVWDLAGPFSIGEVQGLAEVSSFDTNSHIEVDVSDKLVSSSVDSSLIFKLHNLLRHLEMTLQFMWRDDLHS